LRQLNRLVAGAFALAAVGGLAAVPSSASTNAPTDAVTSYASPGTQSCQVTLPGGARAVVDDHTGVESTRMLTSAPGGVASFYSAGHQIVLPMSALRSPTTLDLTAYDTAALAQRTCGLTAPQAAPTTRSGGSGYTLGRLAVHTIGDNGAPISALVLLANVDDNGLARPYVTTGDSGGARVTVPDGHYAALMIGYQGSGGAAFVVDPDFTVTDGTQITLDLRTATRTIPVPTTPKAAELTSTGLDLSRGSGDGDGPGYAYWFNYLNFGSTPVPIRINPAGPARHGHFTVNPAFEFTSPAGTAQPYGYHIAEPTDGVPNSFPTKVDAATLATVTRDYGAPTTAGVALTSVTGEPAWEARTRVFDLLDIDVVPTGASRTEYFSTGPDLVWQTIEDDSTFALQDISSDTVYRAGQHTTENFNTGPLHPSVLLDPTGTTVVCGACSNNDNLLFNIIPFGDNTPGHVATSVDVSAPDTQAYSLSLSRDGVPLAEGAVDPEVTEIAVPRGNAHYELSATTARDLAAEPLSTSSQTTWSFTANPGHGTAIPGDWLCADASKDCSTLPLLFAEYSADANLLNQLTPGAHSIALTVTHQEHSAAPAISGAGVSVSYDDGTTWQPLRTTGSGGTYRAAFTVPAGASGGYVSLRVSAWDRAGNRIDQTVTRAYQVK
jgi:hypothetical protein